jgi:hypothetical protein
MRNSKVTALLSENTYYFSTQSTGQLCWSIFERSIQFPRFGSKSELTKARIHDREPEIPGRPDQRVFRGMCQQDYLLSTDVAELAYLSAVGQGQALRNFLATPIRRSDRSHLGLALRSVTAARLLPGDVIGSLTCSGFQEVPLAAEDPSQRCPRGFPGSGGSLCPGGRWGTCHGRGLWGARSLPGL